MDYGGAASERNWHKMEEAGELIALVQAPVGSLVEDIGGVRLVLAEVPIRTELLILLHSRFPQAVSAKQSVESLSRRDPARVRKILRELRDKKLAHEGQEGYQLTQNGVRLAVEEIKKLKSAELMTKGTGKASRRRKRR